MEAFKVASEGVGMQLEFIWKNIREPLIVPMLRWTVYLCLGLSLIMLVEKVYMAIVICYVKLFKRTPEKCYKFKAIEDDVELGNSNYPMVLVQVPMYNEREVYQLSIGAACELSWPSDRIIIQILDDSTDPTIKVCYTKLFFFNPLQLKSFVLFPQFRLFKIVMD
ncbi:putative glucomannan 4-beta-mannosyltransferase [Medicago truncatula]|uniref:Putative glucomannan 4-beta-mannosyltransferase n=1 Tax=Medicago truncatula TaxID=3880 RepID=A0A396JMX9_MEDTR|nr:putative glucomannan 4-beta-mannosyltransferase [Medicago truncatula]